MGYRGMNLQPANPVMAAVEGYKAVDDIFETNRQRKVADEDRQRRIEQEDRQQSQNDQVWQRQMQQFQDQDTRQELNQARIALMQLGQGDKPVGQEQYDQLVQGFSPKTRELFKSSLPREALPRYQKARSLLHQGMQQVSEGDGAIGKQMIIDAINTGYGDEISLGGAKEGMEVIAKEVVDLRFYGEGGVVPIVKVRARDKSGQIVEYMAPSTKGQDSSAEAKINVIMPEQAARNFDQRAMLADAIDRLLVGSGDNTPMERAEKRQQGGEQAAALGKLFGFSEKEQEGYRQAVQAGIDPVKTAELMYKKKHPENKLTWKENVSIGGKPYHVAYDKDGKAVAQVPQWNKDVAGSGGGAGGGKEGKLPDHIMKLFEVPEQYDSNGYQVSAKSVDQQRLSDFVAFKSKFGRDMSYEDAYAQFDKRGAQAGGGGKPSIYSQLPGAEQADSSAQRVVKSLEKIPGAEDRAAAAQQFLQSDAPDDVKKRFAYHFGAQQERVKGGMDAGKRQQDYAAAGMAPATTTPMDVRSQMFTTMSKAVPNYGVDIVEVAKAVATKAGQGYVAFVKATPVGMATSLVADAVQDFRSWAKNRYKTASAVENPAVLGEYAKENPQSAQVIVSALQGDTEQGPN